MVATSQQITVINNLINKIMGMIEIGESGHKRGSLGRAVKEFKETLYELKENFEDIMEHLEESGERGGMIYDEEYGDRYDDGRMYDNDPRMREEQMGQRRGVKGSGRRRYRY